MTRLYITEIYNWHEINNSFCHTEHHQFFKPRFKPWLKLMQRDEFDCTSKIFNISYLNDHQQLLFSLSLQMQWSQDLPVLPHHLAAIKTEIFRGSCKINIFSKECSSFYKEIKWPTQFVDHISHHTSVSIQFTPRILKLDNLKSRIFFSFSSLV